jgi:hypothetical protein
MTKARTIADLGTGFVNISDTGTEGTKVASGTTAQRGSTAGQLRFNSQTGLAEYYTGTEFKTIDSPPTVTAVSPLEVASDEGGNITFTITGSNFQSGAVVKFIGNDATELTASTTTVNSGSSISAVIARSSFVGAKEPYDVRVINATGLSGTLDNQINVDVSPTWSTASGTLGTFDEGSSINVTVTATDADGDTIVYSVLSGTLPTGLSLNSSTGAITGTAGNINSDTTSSFTLRATANSKTADRAFSITINYTVISPSDIPENSWSSLITGNFESASTYTDYYGGRFNVEAGNIVRFGQAYTSEHVLYQRANCRNNSNEECVVQMYNISDNLGDAAGYPLIMFGIYFEDPTNIGVNNNTPFGYVSSSNTNYRYVTWGRSNTSTNFGFYQGGSNAVGTLDISSVSTNRDLNLLNTTLNSYDLTTTSLTNDTAITFVIKADNHGTNARKVYVYFGNTKIHTFSNSIPASKEIHWWVGNGQNSPSDGDHWSNNPPKIRFTSDSARFNIGS